MNNTVRSTNGNRVNSTLRILHWNAGSRLWTNKLIEIETLLLDKKPDILIISEANI